MRLFGFCFLIFFSFVSSSHSFEAVETENWRTALEMTSRGLLFCSVISKDDRSLFNLNRTQNDRYVLIFGRPSFAGFGNIPGTTFELSFEASGREITLSTLYTGSGVFLSNITEDNREKFNEILRQDTSLEITLPTPINDRTTASFFNLEGFSESINYLSDCYNQMTDNPFAAQNRTIIKDNSLSMLSEFTSRSEAYAEFLLSQANVLEEDIDQERFGFEFASDNVTGFLTFMSLAEDHEETVTIRELQRVYRIMNNSNPNCTLVDSSILQEGSTNLMRGYKLCNNQKFLIIEYLVLIPNYLELYEVRMILEAGSGIDELSQLMEGFEGAILR